MLVERFMHRRPMALFAGLLALGTAVGSQNHVPPAVFAAAMALVGAWFFVKRRVIAVYVLAMLIGAWGAGALTALPAVAPAARAEISGRLCEAPRTGDARVVMTLDRVAVDGRPLDGKLRLYHYGESNAQVGDVVSATAETWHAQGQRNPGGFDFAAFLRRQNVRLCATVKEDLITWVDGPVTPVVLIERLRVAIGETIDRLFPEHAPLARSMLLGDKSALPEDVLESFRTAGLAHLLAVSGLHVTCLAFAISWLLHRLGASRNAAFFTTLPLIALYAAVVGFTASAVRATLMFALVGGARLDGRPYDPLTGLATALVILLAANPLSIGDPGLILSFSAIAGILALAPVLDRLTRADRLKRPFSTLLRAFNMSLAAQLGLLPAQCCLFGTITPYAPLTNLLAIPLGTTALPLIAVAVLLNALVPALTVISFPGSVLLSALTTLSGAVAHLPFANVYAPAWPWPLICAYAVVTALASPYVRARFRRRALMLPALAVVCALSFVIAFARRPDGLTITFLDVGQAAAAAVETEKRLYFVDVGDAGSSADDYARFTGQPVAGVFLTHPHSDHVFGLKELLLAREVRDIYLPGCWLHVIGDTGVNELIGLAQARGARLHFLWAGDVVQLSDSAQCEVLAPARDFLPKDGNQASLMLRLTYGTGSALIAGDLPVSAEPRDVPPTTLIAVPHHGSANSLSNYLLRSASPSAAAISVGRNGYGHPSDAVIGRLAALNLTPYRTDQSGAIIARIRADGTIEMETFL